MMNFQEEAEVVPNAWSSELPTDLLGLIADNLPLSQFIRFGSVCLGWRSFSIENYQHIKLPNQLPVLLIPIPPSSSLLLTHNINKIISFSTSSSSPSPSDDDDEDEEELEPEEKKEKVMKHNEEEEEIETEKEEKEEKEIEIETENEEKETVTETENEDDQDEDKGDRCLPFKRECYYDPKKIWQGQDAKQRYKSTRTFYSLSEKRVYHDFQLPVPYYKNVVGSSYGWLVTVQERYDDDNGQLYLPVSLFNPFRTDNNEIQLPPITNGNPGNLDIGEKVKDSYFLAKAVLSANPSSLSDPTTQLVVFGIYGKCRLAFCRPCDKAWTRLNLEQYRPIDDVICYKGRVYAILQNGFVFAFVLDASQPLPMPIVTLEISPPNDVNRFLIGYHKRYVVESGGYLLQIMRNFGSPTLAESGRPYPPTEAQGYITCQFLVFKLDPKGHWVEMKTLDDHMLFIGTSTSVSLSASDFPGWSTPNSIYYTDDHYERYVVRPLEGPHDIGIFNLEDGSFERHYEVESKTIMPSPIWILPML